MDEILKKTGRIEKIYTEDIELSEPFYDFASRFASNSGTIVLMSGGNLDCARYHIMAIRPFLTITGYRNNISAALNDKSFQYEKDPFEFLKSLLDYYKLSGQDFPLPVASGLFGYLSYDLKDCIEVLPRTTVDDLNLPHLYFIIPSIIVIHDKIENKTRLCIPERNISGQSTLADDLKYFNRMFNIKLPEESGFSGGPEGLRSNFNKNGYCESIIKIKNYIKKGDVYQVNMTQRFKTDFKGNSYSLFKKLYNENPAPFFAYLNCGDHQIISTSPERFIQQNGERVETRPIKGTRPRGKTPEEDNHLKEVLLNSRKDDAELSMIVDLLRNDIGKVCSKGSVKVVKHKKIEAYQNVYHLVSIVEGELENNRDSVDLVKSTFPGGSITGCPKIRSMEIIDELETNRRHIYTGSIGYIGFHNNMDLSIAIRTATIFNGKMIFSVGGGIVYDSDPLDEYEETLHKGRTLMESFTNNDENRIVKEYENFIWINGSIKPEDKAVISTESHGFQYGYGFFETIRVDKGKIKFLNDHITRLYSSWKFLFETPVPDLSWDVIISELIRKNGLNDKTAVVKVIAAKEDMKVNNTNNSLIVCAKPYIHILDILKKSGLDLGIFKHPRQTFLADYKTLNYLFYFLAGKWAKENKYDEAVIINPDGSLSETNTANLLIIRNKTVIDPVSSNVLPGIMKQVVIELLKTFNYHINNNKIRPDGIRSDDQLIVTNSLMGAVPVLSVEHMKTADASALCNKINDMILYGDAALSQF